MSAGHTAMADYTLTIKADSGYESTTEGRCTAEQYGAVVAALHTTPNTLTEMREQRDELLMACRLLVAFHDAEHNDCSDAIDNARAAIAKAVTA